MRYGLGLQGAGVVYGFGAGGTWHSSGRNQVGDGLAV